MAYQLEGQLLEVCTCNILCPCWVGEDPDGGTCDGVLSWHIARAASTARTSRAGRSRSSRTFPGNILEGNWRVVVYVDDGATDEQQQALIDVWTGKLGGPMADLAQLVGEVIAVERAPVQFQVEGKGVAGRFTIGKTIEAELEPFTGATGEPSALYDTHLHDDPGLPGVRREGVRVQGRRAAARLRDRPHRPQRGLGRLPLRGVSGAARTG